MQTVYTKNLKYDTVRTILPMDIALFKQTFDPLLARHLASKYTAYKNITSEETVLSILSHIQNVSTGGKRLRPFIIWSLYKSTHTEASIEDIAPLLVAVELFHVFCLIHDDIMDEALVRHGTPTIHTYTHALLTNKRVEKNIERASENQAILAGDIVFNYVFELLNTTSWSTPEIRQNIRYVFTTLVDEVCIGQMLDIHLTTETNAPLSSIIEKNRLKTAYYSFARPLHIGALIAGREDLIDVSLRFGEIIGMLFQVQDDLLDIIGNPKDTKKEMFTDLQENQHTVLTAYIREKSAPLYRDQLDALCGAPKSSLDPETVRKVFTDSGSIAYAQALVQEYITQAEHLVADAHLDSHISFVFTSIISLLRNRTL